MTGGHLITYVPRRHVDGVRLSEAQRSPAPCGDLGEPLPDGAGTPKGFKSGPLLIVAGAGTGKTDTLAYRVAHLVVHGVDPARIMMLTFTRRAATEMRRRAYELAKVTLNETLGGVSQSILQRMSWAGTFHSVGNRLLRHYARHLKIDPQFSVLDRSDSADLIDTMRQELGLAQKEQRFPRKDTCLQIYSHRVNTQRTLKETLEAQFPWCVQWESDLTGLYRAYVERKQRNSLLDYDDLLLYWQIMMSHPQLAAHVGGHFDHVLVDEYQDTNKLQAEILHALRPDGAGLAVVGDDAQAIYSFRAAAVENILGFPDRFTPRAEVITLAQNYRSTQQVLDVANAVMAEAPRQHRKHLLSSRGEGPRPRLVTVEDLQTQAECVCGEVLKRREAERAVAQAGGALSLLEPRQCSGGRARTASDPVREVRRPQVPRGRVTSRICWPCCAGATTRTRPGGLPHAAAPPRHGTRQRAPRPRSPPESNSGTLCLPAGLRAAVRAGPGLAQTARAAVSRSRIRSGRGSDGASGPEMARPHLERQSEHFRTRLGDLDQLEVLSSQYPSRERFLVELTLDPPNATSDLAGRPRWMRLPHPLHHPLRQGHGVGRRLPSST